MKTTAELREIIAEKLRIKSVDLDLSAEDAAKIDRRIDEVTSYFRQRGLIWWADDAIPDHAIIPMTLMVSAWAAADFGKAGQAYETGFNDGSGLLAALRRSANTDDVAADFY